VHVGSGNRNRFRPSLDVIGLYDLASDVRFPAYFASRQSGGGGARPVSAFADQPRKIINKFMTKGATLDNIVNWKVTRTGEMYLIRAEARAMQGGAKEVLGLADLNDLRAARITGYIPAVLTGQALLDAIQTERRRELVGEGHRWFDLKRTTRTINRTETGITSAKTILNPSDREWVWPIPQGELDANPNIQQNPGW
jgi:hypothetical protein